MLDQEISTATALSDNLARTDTPPVFAGVSSQGTYADAVAMLPIATAATTSVNRFDRAGQTIVKEYSSAVQKIVTAGPTAFDRGSRDVERHHLEPGRRQGLRIVAESAPDHEARARADAGRG